MASLLKLSLFLAIFCVANETYASCAQNQNELTGLVGLDSSAGTVYADVKSSRNECGCTKVRFLPSKTNTEMALGILMAAKVSGKKVRIDIADESDCNTAYRVYIH